MDTDPIPVKEQLKRQIRLLIAEVSDPIRTIIRQAVIFLVFFFADVLVSQLVIWWLDLDSREPAWFYALFRQLVVYGKVVSTTGILVYLPLSTIEELRSLHKGKG